MHFPGGDPSNAPQMTIGKKFASPIKKGTPRTQRAKRRESSKKELSACTSRSMTPSNSRSQTPLASAQSPPSFTVEAEQMETDYQVHELPVVDDTPATAVVDTRIQALETENARLKRQEVYFVREMSYWPRLHSPTLKGEDKGHPQWQRFPQVE